MNGHFSSDLSLFPDSVILVSSSSLDDALVLELDRAGVLVSGELVTIRTLPDLLAIDTGYHIVAHLNTPGGSDPKSEYSFRF